MKFIQKLVRWFHLCREYSVLVEIGKETDQACRDDFWTRQRECQRCGKRWLVDGNRGGPRANFFGDYEEPEVDVSEE
jgi:hypothetical protein